MKKPINYQEPQPVNEVGAAILKQARTLPLDSVIDLTLTRVYFTKWWDVLGRTVLFACVVGLAFISIFSGIGIGIIVAKLPGIPAIAVLNQAILRVVTVLFLTFFTIWALLLILPLFLTKSVRGIVNTSISLIFVGNLFILIMIALNAIAVADGFIENNEELMLSFSGVIFIAWNTALFWWWKKAISYHRSMIKMIHKAYRLGLHPLS